MLDLENLEKAQRLSLTMQVEVSLKNALIVGALKPGARLITKEIADKLGTSITPVREALLRLVSAGALHATPAQAFMVPEMTLERYTEINAIRKQLEAMAVGAACQQMTPVNGRNFTIWLKNFMMPWIRVKLSGRSMPTGRFASVFTNTPRCPRCQR